MESPFLVTEQLLVFPVDLLPDSGIRARDRMQNLERASAGMGGTELLEAGIFAQVCDRSWNQVD